MSTAAAILDASAPVRNTRRLRIASVCTVLPTAAAPHRGIFVRRRLDALARVADVRVLQPAFWFPVLRPGCRAGWDTSEQKIPVYRENVFYVPGVLKRFDARWLQHRIEPILRRWHSEFGLDLLDAHFGYPEGVACALAARKIGLPCFITVRGNEADYLRMGGIAPRLRGALQECDAVIAVSHSLRELLVQSDVDPDRVAVVPNGIDRGLFHPGPQPEARAALGLRCDRRYIVSVGRIERKKGHDALLRAFTALRRRRRDVELVLIGPVADARLRRLARDLALERSVHFVGPQPPERIGEWLRAADVFALPSHREGCCNAVLEALACGVPVVTTPVGDNERYVIPGRTGALVPPGDDRQLAESLEGALEYAWDRPGIARRMAALGWESVARSVLNIFEAHLGRSKVSR